MSATQEIASERGTTTRRDRLHQLLATGPPARLVSLARYLAGDSYIADDLVQETCLTALLKADQLYSDDEAGVLRWLQAILRNKFREMHRSEHQPGKLPFDVGELISTLDRLEDEEAARYATSVVRQNVRGKQLKLLDAILVAGEEGGAPSNEQLAALLGMRPHLLRALLAKLRTKAGKIKHRELHDILEELVTRDRNVQISLHARGLTISDLAASLAEIGSHDRICFCQLAVLLGLLDHCRCCHNGCGCSCCSDPHCCCCCRCNCNHRCCCHWHYRCRYRARRLVLRFFGVDEEQD
jgi:DNA-directed RNA polymerase specialized sigma24 family protein